MGDAVNLASRLEGANKAYGSDLMISQFTFEAVREEVDVRELDTLRVVGRNEPVTVYQLLDRKNSVTGQRADLVEQFGRGLDLYKQRDFQAAQAAFTKADEIIADDGPTLTYIARCTQFAASPPAADWDGVFNLEEKG